MNIDISFSQAIKQFSQQIYYYYQHNYLLAKYQQKQLNKIKYKTCQQQYTDQIFSCFEFQQKFLKHPNMTDTCLQAMEPPNWTIAESHGNAVKVGISKHKHWRKANIEYQICPCCFKYIDKDPIPYSENTKELAFLGKGFPLYFSFIRFCVMLLMVFIMDSCIINIIMNLKQNNCLETLGKEIHSQDYPNSHQVVECSKSIMVNIAYISTEIPSIQRQALKILSFVIELIVLVYIRYNQKHLSNYLDERDCNIQHFTVQIKNIPLGYINNQFRIKSLIQSIADESGEQLEVKQILILEDLSEYLEFENKNKKLHQKRLKLIKANNHPQRQIVERQIISIQNEIRMLKEIMSLQEQQYFLGRAIVSLNTEHQKNYLIKKVPQLPEIHIRKFYPNYTYEQNGLISCSTAPEPADIIWENIHHSKVKRIIALGLGWLVSIILLGLLTLVLFYILKGKSALIEEAVEHYNHDPAHYQTVYNRGIFLGYLSIVIITLFNKFILAYFCHHISFYQKHTTQTSLEFSFSLKYMLGMFFTTAFLTLAVEALVFNNYSHHYGVVEQQTFMSVLNALFSPLVWLINPWYLLHKLKVKMNFGRSDVTQQQANKIMQYPEYNLGKRYAQIMKTMWFTIFYAYLIPVASLISLVGIILYYFVDKYNLLRKCSLKQTMSNTISHRMMKLLDFTLLFLIVGDILFDLQIRNYVSLSSIVMFVVALIYLILPLDSILDYALEEKFHLDRLSYDEAKVDFDMLYLTSYPLRRQRAMHQIIENRKLYKKTITIKSMKTIKEAEYSIDEIMHAYPYKYQRGGQTNYTDMNLEIQHSMTIR